MIDDWLDQYSDDEFNPNDHDIETDEIAELYAISDMKEDQEIWAREQANKFYNDFGSLNISDAVIAVNGLIRNKILDIKQVNTLLDNMIEVFLADEEYEKCQVCNEIKKGLTNARI